MPIRPLFSRFCCAAMLCLALGACVPPPVFESATPPLDVDAETVARAPERYHDEEVVWGGRIVDVRNRADASELVVLAYPLDRGQRPRPKGNGRGRFIVELSGYVENYDYPPGRLVTIAGKLSGSFTEQFDGRDYVYPLVKSNAVHLWPLGVEHGWPKIHFGIGLRGAIR